MQEDDELLEYAEYLIDIYEDSLYVSDIQAIF